MFGFIAAIISIILGLVSIFISNLLVGAGALLLGILGLLFGFKKKRKSGIIASAIGIVVGTVAFLLFAL